MSSPLLFAGLRKYCAGNHNMVPYKASAAEQFNLFFVVERSPRNISGSCSNHLVLVNSARSKVFRLRSSLSTMPFALGWYGVVWMFLVPRSCDNLWNSSDSSVRRHSFWYTVPATYLARNVLAVMYDIISGIGNASHHLENLSTHVNKDDCPSHQGSGPMMSMWMCLNFSPGAGNSPTGACVYRLALVLWHFKNDFVYALTSALIRS